MMLSLAINMRFVPFTRTVNGEMKFNPVFPIVRTIEEARNEVIRNPLARQYALEYREMTASELLTLYRQEAH